MVLLILPAAALMSAAGLNAIEKAVILCAWLAPAILMFVSLRVRFGPLVSVAMLAVLIRHVQSAGTSREVPA
jgi:hypothetical protein